MDRKLLLAAAVIALVVVGSLEARAEGSGSGIETFPCDQPVPCYRLKRHDFDKYNRPRPTPHNRVVGPTRDDARNWAGMAAAMDFAGFPMGKKLAANFQYANVDMDEGAIGGAAGYRLSEHFALFAAGAVGVDNGDGGFKAGFQVAY